MRLFDSRNRTKPRGTVAEVRRLVGRDWRMGASLIASLPIASAPLARDSCRRLLPEHRGSRKAAQDPTLAPR